MRGVEKWWQRPVGFGNRSGGGGGGGELRLLAGSMPPPCPGSGGLPEARGKELRRLPPSHPPTPASRLQGCRGVRRVSCLFKTSETGRPPRAAAASLFILSCRGLRRRRRRCCCRLQGGLGSGRGRGRGEQRRAALTAHVPGWREAGWWKPRGGGGERQTGAAFPEGTEAARGGGCDPEVLVRSVGARVRRWVGRGGRGDGGRKEVRHALFSQQPRLLPRGKRRGTEVGVEGGA